MGWALTLALSLGSTRSAASPLVVLDPGHGGHLSGAIGVNGAEEKDLALAIARLTGAQLRQAGLRVRYTRTRDRHISLSRRSALAGSLKAAAFVSIHLNHAPDPERRGWETYVRSADDPDAATLRLLKREEGAEPPLVVRKHEEQPAHALGFILSDLSRGFVHERSAHLAAHVQAASAGVSGLAPSRGLRQAPFSVLVGARVPSILVEVGYLSNPSQAAFLSSSDGQRAAARALARGIVRFVREVRSEGRLSGSGLSSSGGSVPRR